MKSSYSPSSRYDLKDYRTNQYDQQNHYLHQNFQNISMNRLFIAIQIIVTLPGQAQTKQNFKNCLSNKKKFRFKCIEDRFSNGKFSSITILMFFKMIYSRFLHFHPKLVKSFLPQYSIQYLDQELTHTLKAQKKILIHYTNRSFKANSIIHLL